MRAALRQRRQAAMRAAGKTAEAALARPQVDEIELEVADVLRRVAGPRHVAGSDERGAAQVRRKEAAERKHTARGAQTEPGPQRGAQGAAARKTAFGRN